MHWDYDPRNVSRAQTLRKGMTPQEQKLWYQFLRRYAVKFYRQRMVASYILDLYCPTAKLAVELDGGQHYEEAGRQYDQRRTGELERLGIEVLRFTNTDVSVRFYSVCTVIDQRVKARGGRERAQGERDGG